ncbi:MAG: NUDIX hydrolase [Acidimicrobiales bacterium]|nr:NUDIX hydrolase [Actinomycetota bacterium]
MVAVSDSETLVRAAGGVLRRTSPSGETEVLLVHRPKYDDWTFPKGKLDPGEDEVAGALREVKEETGLRCSLGEEIGSTSYRDSRGRPKLVRYWVMVPIDGMFRPNSEVDEIRWASLSEAAETLTYDRDRPILASLPG